MNKVTEIVTAWAVSFNPSEEQKQLANNRYQVCLDCDKRKKKLGIEICDKCGCPLSKKIFTQQFNQSCPLNKWNTIDDEYYKKLRKKNKVKLL